MLRCTSAIEGGVQNVLRCNVQEIACGYRGDAHDRGWRRRGGTLSWWRDGREGGWQGEGTARKGSLEHYREWRKEAAGSGKGSNEKETVRKLGNVHV